MAHVAGVHDDEGVVDSPAPPTRGCGRGCGEELLVSTQLGITSMRLRTRRPSPRDAASSSRRSRPRGRPGAGRARPAARGADDERVLQALHALRDLGEDVLADDEERHAEPRATTRSRCRRRPAGRSSEHEIRPLAAHGGEDRLAEVAPVVGRAQVELRAVVRRRADTNDLDAVPDLLDGQVEPCSWPVTTVTS